MYRIKTDIRQFKCDTREKVEKLIRNWVIRPTDLLYYRDQKRWAPIGDSEEFEPIFQQIKDSSEDDEETIVTAREDSPAALIDAKEEEEEAPAPRARPSAAVLRPSKKVVRKSAPEPLPMPEAPEGVEEAVVDHEVTVMTERTADLLGLRDSDDIQMTPQDEDVDDEATLADDSEPQLSRSDLPEELFLTNELSAPEPISDPDDSVLDELGAASSIDDSWGDLDGLDENSAFADEEDERATVELDVADIKLEDRRRRREAAQDGDEEVTAITRAPSSDDRAAKRAAPKEPSSTVFVDASYGSDEPDALQDEPLLDEPLLDDDLPRSASSGEYDDLPAPVSAASADPYADLPAPVASSTSDPYDDLPAPVSASAPADPYDDLPAPVSDSSGRQADPYEDLPAPVDPFEPTEEHVFEPAPTPEPEPAPNASAEPSLEAASEPDPFASSLDDDIEDLPELDVIEPVDDDAFEDLLEVEEVKPFVQDRDFVSEGYKLDLPFTVAPTPEDIAAGVKRSTATLAQKNKAFPYPKPKKIGEVQLRTYGDTKDYSLYFVVGAVVLVLLVIISVVVLMSP